MINVLSCTQSSSIRQLAARFRSSLPPAALPAPSVDSPVHYRTLSVQFICCLPRVVGHCVVPVMQFPEINTVSTFCFTTSVRPLYSLVSLSHNSVSFHFKRESAFSSSSSLSGHCDRSDWNSIVTITSDVT